MMMKNAKGTNVIKITTEE